MGRILRLRHAFLTHPDIVKTLILLRHAKSSWDDASLDDHDRPLEDRGRRAAPVMAAHLDDQGFTPELVLCSTAVRTRETLELIADDLDAPPVEYDPGLYLAGPGRLLRAVRAVDGDVKSVMVIGHNPGIHTFALGLCDRSTGSNLRRLERKFPTAAVAVLEFDVNSWDEIDQGTGRLVHFMRPKDLPSARRHRL